MKKTQFDRLADGQLVRLRLSGPGSKSPEAVDEIEVARMVGTTRYRLWRSRLAHASTVLEHDGLTLLAGCSVASTGEARLVVIERTLSRYSESPDRWSTTRSLRLVTARDIESLWDDNIETAALAARTARRAAAAQADADAQRAREERWAAAAAAFDKVKPVADAAGVHIPGWARTSTNPVLTVAQVAAIVDHLTGQQ